MNNSLRGALLLISLALFGCPTAPTVRVPPKAIFQARPTYPIELRSNRLTGEVLVGFVVNTEGVPVDVKAVRSSRKEFEAPAVNAVRKWRFEPGSVDGRPENTPMAVPIIFTMDEQPVR